MDIKELAIESADLYLQYLNDNKQDKGVQKYQINQIKRSRNSNEKHIFYLELDKAPHMNDSLQIKIKDKFLLDPSDKEKELIKPIECNKKRKMIVVSVVDRYLDVLIHANPSDLTIISDMKFLIERVRNWYNSYGDDISFPLPGLSTVPFNNSQCVTELSKEQKEAIYGILANPFTYIWGAPGTGKTQVVLSNAVLSYTKQGKKVLITAPTNSSLEQTLEGLLPVMEKAGIDYNKYVVRHGTASSNFSEKYPGVCEDTTIDSLQSRINETEIDLIFLKKHVALQQFQDIFKSLKPELVALSKEYTNHQISITHLETKKSILLDKRGESLTAKKERVKKEEFLIHKLKRSENSIFKHFNKRKTIVLKESLQDTIKTIDQLCEEIDTIDRSLDDLLDQISKVNESLQKRSANFEMGKRALLSAANTIPELYAIIDSSTIINFLNCASEIDTFLLKHTEGIIYQSNINSLDTKECEAQIFKLSETLHYYQEKKKTLSFSANRKNTDDCLVFAITVDSLLTKYKPNEDCFDHIFLDEAGYCPLIKGCTLFAFDCPVTLLGDHMQLPPVCEMPKKVIMQENNWPVFLWATSAIYAEYAIEDDVKNLYQSLYFNHNVPHKTIEMKQYKLLTTYRFSDSLATLLNDYHIYSKGFRGLPNATTKLYFIDAKRSKPQNGRTSQAEAEVIIDYVKKHKSENIGIITPYVAQKEIIKNNIKTIGFPFENVLTVHRSQSKEWDTILFSVVDTNDKWFMDSLNEKSGGKFIINTAVSRAKKKMIIVCDYNYWIGQKKQLICKLLENAEELII